jgi:hypothetical protein
VSDFQEFLIDMQNLSYRGHCKERDAEIGELTAGLERLRETFFARGGSNQGNASGDERPNSVFERNLAALTAMAKE